MINPATNQHSDVCFCNFNQKNLSIHQCLFSISCSAFDYDTENMNSEDIYSSLKGVTEAIQNFSVRSQEDMDPVQRREGDEVGACITSCQHRLDND